MKHIKDFKLFEAGESDSDFTDVNMDKIVELLKAEGYDAYYKEFDKYQGVYLVIKKGANSIKLWLADTYSTGKWGNGAISSVLIDENGDRFSGNAGDYFNLPKDHVFQGSKLIYKFKKDGKTETKEIENPKVSDFPDVIGKSSNFTPEKEIMVFTFDSGTSSIEYEVGSNDVSEFIDLLKKRNMKYLQKLNEYINFNKINDISISISQLLEYKKIYIIRNIDNPKIFTIDNNKLVETDNMVFKLSNLIDNYKYQFDKYDIKRSEIIKIEYENYNWIVIFLCYTKQDNYSSLSYSPDFNNDDIILKFNNFLENKNFKIIKNEYGTKKLTSSFINGLVKIFRNISGRYYTSRSFPEIKKEFDLYKNNNSEQWSIFEKWKMKNLGSKVKCIRFFDLSSNMDIMLTNGNLKKVNELNKNDNFYYPISNRYFSQWSEINNDNIENIKGNLKMGIESSTNFGVISEIPINKIIFSNSILMYNFSPHVKEKEIIIEHDINDKWDKKIICKIV